jgi:hypothetical protein
LECTQREGWGIDQSGVKAPIKVDEGFSIRQFSAPDEMVVLMLKTKWIKMRLKQCGMSKLAHRILDAQ